MSNPTSIFVARCPDFLREGLTAVAYTREAAESSLRRAVMRALEGDQWASRALSFVFDPDDQSQWDASRVLDYFGWFVREYNTDGIAYFGDGDESDDAIRGGFIESLK